MLRLGRLDVPTSVAEVVSRPAALLVIDMQNDYCAPDGGVHRAGGDISMYEATIPRIAAFAAVCRARDVPVFHVRILALLNGGSDTPAYARLRLRAKKNGYQRHEGEIWDFTVEGTWGAEFVDGLQPHPGDRVITKYRSSALFRTDLDLLLRALQIETVFVAGCTTEGCVETTVRDLGMYDYFPVVLSDCVGSDAKELHDASMLVMSAYRADIASSREVLDVWQQSVSMQRAESA